MVQSSMKQGSMLFFHSPCFDGIASAVIAGDFLQARRGWDGIEFRHVNYDSRKTWLSQRFEHPTAVVDFLYHPDAAFWADHHMTTFLTDGARSHFERRTDENVIYDERADSCAGLLWRNLWLQASHRNEQYRELVQWAEKIDAARYESVDEAFSFEKPALQISLSLAFANDTYCEFLVHTLRHASLAATSELPEVREKFARAQSLLEGGFERFKHSATLRDDLAIFNVDGQDVMISRYAPYRLYPRARYSIGAVRNDRGVKITAMRNPWIEFDSVPLGEIFTRFGGGGHQRVASVMLLHCNDDDARKTLTEIIEAIEAEDRKQVGAEARS